MSRLLLLFTCLIWLAGASRSRPLPIDTFALGFLAGGVAMLVLIVAGWSRLIARGMSGRTFARSLHRLNWLILATRFVVTGAFAAAVFAFGWVEVVQDSLRLRLLDPWKLPSLIVGISPALLAWIGFWWAHYPADNALRVQGLAENVFDPRANIHQPPTLAEHLMLNVRLQVLFTLAPLMLIVLIRDVATFALPTMQPTVAASRVVIEQAQSHREQIDALIWLLSAGVVYVLAPEMLRRILPTSSMRDGPLRRRLETLCRRSGMKYRDILVWHTHHNVGNAAVMGLVPRFRYVLLSDLLIDRMSDEQIEAVFAHEIGHVVHRHMAWYIVFFLILTLLSLGPVSLATSWLDRLPLSDEAWACISLTVSALGFWVLFGFLSRRFERQADVYAARIMEAGKSADPARSAAALAPLLGETPRPAVGRERDPHYGESHVGTYGAQLFASALHKVAIINNIPVSPRSPQGAGVLSMASYLAGSLTDLAHDWLHGSISSRMDYLRSLALDPAATGRFDRVMTRLYAGMLFVLIASAAYLVPTLMR